MARKPKIGRPKKSAREVRGIILKIRLSRDELSALKAAATGELSTWAREVLLKATGRK